MGREGAGRPACRHGQWAGPPQPGLPERTPCMAPGAPAGMPGTRALCPGQGSCLISRSQCHGMSQVTCDPLCKEGKGQ